MDVANIRSVCEDQKLYVKVYRKFVSKDENSVISSENDEGKSISNEEDGKVIHENDVSKTIIGNMKGSIELIRDDNNTKIISEASDGNMSEDNGAGDIRIIKNSVAINGNDMIGDMNGDPAIVRKNLRPKRKREFANEGSSKRPRISRNKWNNEERNVRKNLIY